MAGANYCSLAGILAVRAGILIFRAGYSLLSRAVSVWLPRCLFAYLPTPFLADVCSGSLTLHCARAHTYRYELDISTNLLTALPVRFLGDPTSCATLARVSAPHNAITVRGPLFAVSSDN